MLSPLIPPALILLLVASASTMLLLRDVNAGRLRERVGAVRVRAAQQAAPVVPVLTLNLRSAAPRSGPTVRLMHLLRLNPDIPGQNVIPWKLVIALSALAALLGFFYGRAFLGGPVAALAGPFAGFFLARYIFGWERARYQRALLQQIPEVMVLICRAVSAGIPLSEALNCVARDAPTPSREEFARVNSDVAIGQPLERALWKLHERVGLSEYAFFAVTIGLQAQTGGSLVETLGNLQDLVSKRVAMAKRGKALAAEARMSAKMIGVLPFLMSFLFYFIRPGFLEFFLDTPTGNHLLLVGCGLMGMGILAMRQMISRSLAL
jgi:tight adherence protein B